MSHLPVLLKETLELLDPQPGEFFIDGTLGNGGHAAEIIKKISPNGTFLGIDWDRSAIADFKLTINYQCRCSVSVKKTVAQAERAWSPMPRIGGARPSASAPTTLGSETACFRTETEQRHYQLSKVIFETVNYTELPRILTQHNLPKADGLLLDLGFSSEQIASGRGFSFRNSPAGEEPLSMTYSDEEKPVSELLNKLSVKDLENIIRTYGEERFAGRIAKAIKSHLPIKTSGKLAEIIALAVPKNYERGRIHPATRTFQALRIFANRELQNLESILKIIPEIITKNGRVAIISFHSLEDRLVKNYFKNLVKEEKVILLNKKPIVASLEEIKSNPKSRSAKLRAIRIIFND